MDVNEFSPHTFRILTASFQGKDRPIAAAFPGAVPEPLKRPPPNPFSSKGLFPLGNTGYIDVEFQEIADQLDLSDRFRRCPDFRLRNAFSQYHNLAQRRPRKQPMD